MGQKKRWGIKEPIQWKFGNWYSSIIDPDSKEIVFETIGYSKQTVFNTCIEWATQKNIMLEQEEPVAVIEAAPDFFAAISGSNETSIQQSASSSSDIEIVSTSVETSSSIETTLETISGASDAKPE